MPVIGFFQGLFSSMSGLIYFINTPLGEQFEQLKSIPVIGEASIVSLLGVGLVATLGVLLVIHLVRLFIGG